MLKKNIVKFFATGAYAGYFPVAPGTAGTAAGVIIVYLASLSSPFIQIAAAAAIIAASIPIASAGLKLFGGKDPGQIVFDEIAGTMVSFFLMPVNAPSIAIIFILFRIFDILKPFPAGLIDRKLEGGAGVVLDDVAAGIYANIAGRFILWALG
ncbi:MAG: phosphatidylglycerophosphatase A [Deltaproteobacteria bacterium]|nr:phosphatidylglycerophosphatase A [Deltaproteobacteria bacterium]